MIRNISHCAEAIKQMSQDVRINTLINQAKAESCCSESC